MTCSNCDSILTGSFCASCGHANEPPKPTEAQMAALVRRSEVRHGVPALLSFFVPGIGQLIKGNLGTAFTVWGGIAALAVMAGAGLWFTLFAIPVIWIYSLYDAYVAPDGPTRREFDRFTKPMIILVACALATIGCGSVTAIPTPDAGGTGGAGGKIGVDTGAAGANGSTGGMAGGAALTGGVGGTAPGTGGGGGVIAIGTGGGGGTIVITTGSGGSSLPSYTFDSSTQGFIPGTLVGTDPAISHNGSIGQGSTPGCLEVDADFVDYQQSFDVMVPLSPPIDLSHATIHAAVEVKQSFFGSAVLFVKSTQGALVVGSSGTGLTNGSFTALAFNIGALGPSSGFDPTSIQAIGVRIYSNPNPGGGTFPAGSYTFYIDNVLVLGQ